MSEIHPRIWSWLLCHWGKTDKDDPTKYHPAIFHMLDSAAAAYLILDRICSPGIERLLAKEFGVKVSEVKNIICFWVALHDLGKISPGFEEKSNAHNYFKGNPKYPSSFENCSDHGRITDVTLWNILEPEIKKLFEDSKEREKVIRNIEYICRALGGHHGIFKETDPKVEIHGCGKGQWDKDRKKILSLFLNIFGLNNIRYPNNKTSALGICIFSGLTTFADWIASSSTQRCEISLSDRPFNIKNINNYLLEYYNKQAIPRIEKELERIGCLKWSEVKLKEEINKKDANEIFGTIFPNYTPNSLQKTCFDLVSKNKSEQFLLIIEGLMGHGKTEAAWISILLSGEIYKGIYHALHTQATCNQMYWRFAQFLTRCFEGDITAYLMHSMSRLNKEYYQTKEEKEKHDKALDSVIDTVSGGIVDDEDKKRISVHEWFLNNKKAILTPYAVGTVDQLLLGVLVCKHFFVRLFGMYEKNVIIDEVHAYDAYTNGLLERLLSWLSVMNCNVILLSATLPKEKREKLIEAFRFPFKKQSFKNTKEKEIYPRITFCTKKSTQVKTFDCDRTEVVIDSIDSLSVESKILESISEGGCAVLICNNVNQSRQRYETLLRIKDPDTQVILFNSKFLHYRRNKIEKEILALLSKNGIKDNNRPKKLIVVATPVIEQSLDIDFDVMFSELCPIDLLLQRIGRLHRFIRSVYPVSKRPNKLQEAKFYYIEPGEVLYQDENGANRTKYDFGSNGKSTHGIYEDAILLWTLQKIKTMKKIRLPEDVCEIIEFVYGRNLAKEIEKENDSVVKNWIEKMSERIDKKQFESALAVLPRPDKVENLMNKVAIEIDDDDEYEDLVSQLFTDTRLEEYIQKEVICIYKGKDNKYYLASNKQEIDIHSEDKKYWRNPSLLRELFNNSVRLPIYLICDIGMEPLSVWEKNPILKRSYCLILKENGDNDRGIKCGSEYIVENDNDLGVRWKKRA